MKKTSPLFVLLLTVACLGISPSFAWAAASGGASTGPKFDGALRKLFGDTQAFSADMEFTAPGAKGKDVVMVGKMSINSGKSRFEMDMASMAGDQMPPEALAQMKAMGMDRTVMISRMDRNIMMMIYPGMQSYFEMAIPKTDASDGNESDFKVDIAKVGAETVDGHPCVKNKATVTDKEGRTHEFFIWCASDLKDFPIRIQASENGTTFTMTYRNISFAKPDDALFEAPAGYTKYASQQAMMQTEMMKRMSAVQGSAEEDGQ